MKSKRNTVWMRIVISLGAMVFGMAPMSAYAQANEVEEEQKMEAMAEEVTEYPEQEENFGPLTPDGNLTLVDDYGAPEGGGKQFITVVTKAGNYFYIIIDRDDEGDETVHFLNMVDESDLLALMDDEEAKAYVESVTQEEPVVEESEDQSVSAGDVPDQPDPDDKPKKKVTGVPKAIVPIALFAMIGGGAYLFIGKGKTKKVSKPRQDPDADYREEEDYLAGIDEEKIDEEIAAEFDAEDDIQNDESEEE